MAGWSHSQVMRSQNTGSVLLQIVDLRSRSGRRITGLRVYPIEKKTMFMHRWQNCTYDISSYLCIYIYIYLLCIYYVSIYLSIYPSIHPSIHLSIYLSLYNIYIYVSYNSNLTYDAWNAHPSRSAVVFRPLIPARQIHLYTDEYNDSWLAHATGNPHISG